MYPLPTPEERSDAVRVANFRAERSARVDQVRAHTTRTNSPYQQHLNLHRGRGPPPEVRPDNTRLQITYCRTKGAAQFQKKYVYVLRSGAKVAPHAVRWIDPRAENMTRATGAAFLHAAP